MILFQNLMIFDKIINFIYRYPCEAKVGNLLILRI